jgi:predicted transcriptional regulator
VRKISAEISIYDQSIAYLHNAGYDIFTNRYSGMEMCFEILARHKSHSQLTPNLVIKIVDNIDSIKSHIINEIKLVSQLMAAIPLVLGKRNRHSELEQDSIYLRQDLISINIETFHKIILSPQLPLALAIAKKGGLFYSIDGEKLSELRKAAGFSRKMLAEKLEVSSKAISQYELKGMRASKQNAMHMKQILGDSVIQPLDFFRFLRKNMNEFTLDPRLQKKITSKTKEFMASINEIVEDAGYRIFWPRTSPFDLLIFQEDEDNFKIADYTFVGGTQCEAIYKQERQNVQKEFIQNVPQESAFVVEEEEIDKKMMKTLNVPYIIPKELKTLENPEEFKALIKKRKKTP